MDRETLIRWAGAPLRIMIGFGFVFHGAPKLFSPDYHEQFVGMLSQIGVPLPEAAAWLVGLVETLGGLALVAGLAVSVASALLLPVMLVAMFTVHWDHGFSFMNVVGTTEGGAPQFGMPGFEVNLLYISGLVTLILLDRLPRPEEGDVGRRAAARSAERPAEEPAAASAP